MGTSFQSQRRLDLLALLECTRANSGQVFMMATEENWPRELMRDVRRWGVKAGELARH